MDNPKLLESDERVAYLENSEQIVTTISTSITLRDLFAMAALSKFANDSEPYEVAAEDAYRYADAMLSEREKRNGNG